jgi:hypothetical protein
MTLDPDHEGMIRHRFVFIHRKTRFPELLRPANDATGSDWVHVAPDWIHVPNDTNVRRLERELFAAGWTFLYAATTISAFGFGFGFGFDSPRKFGD